VPVLLVATAAQVAAVYAPGDVSDPTYAEPVRLDWGDGSAPIGVVFGSPGALVQHVYAAPGDYTVTVTGRTATGDPFAYSIDLTMPSDTLDVTMPAAAVDDGLPLDGPATLDGAKAQGSISAAHDAELQRVVDAVNAQVRRWPVAERSRGQADWQPDTALGANMLAVRFWRRKDTPGGVEVYGDFGIAYVRRLDPDVAQLLELGDWSRPRVG
jgi:hypothetical protein